MPTIILNLTHEEINTIINALQEIPAKFANPLTQKIVDQASVQINPPQPPIEDVNVDNDSVSDGGSDGTIELNN